MGVGRGAGFESTSQDGLHSSGRVLDRSEETFCILSISYVTEKKGSNWSENIISPTPPKSARLPASAPAILSLSLYGCSVSAVQGQPLHLYRGPPPTLSCFSSLPWAALSPSLLKHSHSRVHVLQYLPPSPWPPPHPLQPPPNSYTHFTAKLLERVVWSHGLHPLFFLSITTSRGLLLPRSPVAAASSFCSFIWSVSEDAFSWTWQNVPFKEAQTIWTFTVKRVIISLNKGALRLAQLLCNGFLVKNPGLSSFLPRLPLSLGKISLMVVRGLRMLQQALCCLNTAWEVEWSFSLYFSFDHGGFLLLGTPQPTSSYINP